MDEDKYRAMRARDEAEDAEETRRDRINFEIAGLVTQKRAADKKGDTAEAGRLMSEIRRLHKLRDYPDTGT